MKFVFDSESLFAPVHLMVFIDLDILAVVSVESVKGRPDRIVFHIPGDLDPDLYIRLGWEVAWLDQQLPMLFERMHREYAIATSKEVSSGDRVQGGE